MTHVKKNAVFALIAALMLVSLACGVATKLPQDLQYAVTLSPLPAPENVVTMQVNAEIGLNVRNDGSPDAKIMYQKSNGETVTVYLDCPVKIDDYGTHWLAINESCSRWVSGNYLTMTEAK